LSNLSKSRNERSAIPARVGVTVLSSEEMDNECLSRATIGTEAFDDAEKLSEIVDTWVNRTGWNSFVKQVREVLGAEAFLILEITAEESPNRFIAQSYSEECSVAYPGRKIPDFLLANEILTTALTKKKRFDETMDPSFLAFRYLHGQLLLDRNGKPIAALVVGFDDEGMSEDSSFNSSVSLVASLVSTQIDFDREVASRKEIESMLRHSQKLTSVGRLATGIAHDFNNLLTVIQGHTSLLEMVVEKVGDEKATESLGLIHSASLQAVELSKQLLLFSRQEPVNLERCDLNQVVREFVKMMRRVVEETIDFEIQLGHGLNQIEADRSMLGQVMMNLIVNARHAMPNGGRITLSTSVHSLSAGKGEIAPGNYACLSIKDNGSGIPTDKLPKIFDPFFTTKEEGKGTGLGLANVAAIIREHGGHIGVSSQVGEGTNFEILLPMMLGLQPLPEKEKKEHKFKDSLKNTTILLVEDEDGVRKLVRKLLEMLGCDVIETSSGRDALNLWPKISEKISLVVTDVVMPGGVSGWDLAKKLHSTHPDLGILLTSGYNERPENHGLGAENQIAFLQKPYEAMDLKRTLLQLLTGEPVKAEP